VRCSNVHTESSVANFSVFLRHQEVFPQHRKVFPHH
jgi:hypothetical protein